MADTKTVPAIQDTRAKVQDFLSQFDDVEIDDEGNCCLRYGSARVDVGVQVFDEDSAVVLVKAACVTGAKASPDLFEHIATEASPADFGHLSADKASDGTVTIHFSHSMLGEFLNASELRMVVVAVAFTADQLDDDLARRFGGTVYDATANRS